jgi:hypothetical protein
MDGLHLSVKAHGGEVAHLKVIGTDEGGAFGVANLVSSDEKPVLSLPSNIQTRSVDVIVNARIAIDPDILEADVKKIVNVVCGELSLQATFRKSQSLRPGRPMPTHRYETAV